jgi:hypothetical protein
MATVTLEQNGRFRIMQTCIQGSYTSNRIILHAFLYYVVNMLAWHVPLITCAQECSVHGPAAAA